MDTSLGIMQEVFGRHVTALEKHQHLVLHQLHRRAVAAGERLLRRDSWREIGARVELAMNVVATKSPDPSDFRHPSRARLHLPLHAAFALGEGSGGVGGAAARSAAGGRIWETVCGECVDIMRRFAGCVSGIMASIASQSSLLCGSQVECVQRVAVISMLVSCQKQGIRHTVPSTAHACYLIRSLPY